jgi:hypothetical protein
MKNKIEAPVVIAVVAHTTIDHLQEIKQTFENLDGFKIIHFVTSSRRLYVTEEEGVCSNGK